jgi:hypothetical protein
VAIAVDKASIGGATQGPATGTSFGFTTNQVVASSGFIVVIVSWFLENTTLSNISGGGLTWAIDRQGVNPTAAQQNIALCSAQAPSGLASGQTLTANFSGSSQGITISGMSFTGVKTSAAEDVDTATAGNNTTNWATNSASIAAGSVLVGAAVNEAATDGAVTTGTQAHEFWDGLSYGHVVGYRIEPSAGSYTIAGTFNAAQPWTAGAVAYLKAPDADNTMKPARAGMWHPELVSRGWF